MSTTSFQRLGTAGLAALTLVGLLSGCSSKKTAASTSATTSAAAGAAATSAPAGASAAIASAAAQQPSPTKVVATGGGKFCQQVAAEVNSSSVAAAAGGTGADSIKASVAQYKSIESSVLKSAPNEIKPDLITLFGAIDQFYAALAKVNYDFTKVDPSVEAPLETTAVQAAEAHVDAYLKGTCGIDTGAGNASSAEAQASAAEKSLQALVSAAGSPSS